MVTKRRPIAGAADYTIEKVTQVRGLPIPVRSASMDRFLDEEDRRVLYERWQEDWPTPVGLQGGGLMVTAEMVRQISWKALSGAYGAKRAKVYKDIAEEQV